MKNLFLICAAVFALLIAGCPSNDSRIGDPDNQRIDRNQRHSDRWQKIQLLQEHNEQRRSKRLHELYEDRDLAEAAQEWAEHMRDRNRLYHGSLRSKVDSNQFRLVGENIAWGQENAEEATKSWMNSWGHRRNILNDDFYFVGFGVAEDRNGRIYWCAIFGGAKTEPERHRDWPWRYNN